jgi:IS30 family transposase
VNERERDKNAARRLAILRHAEEVTGNVALTCRYYGITRQAFYLWRRRRYETGGLDALRDRSRRPRSCPHETPTEIVGKIIYLRQNYHFGPTKIAMYLKRYHDVQISDSGVWRILKRLGLNRLPASQRYKPKDRRWKRYEKQLPGHHVQIDVKFIAPITTAAAPGPGEAAAATGAPAAGRRKKYYQYTAIDDCTRLRVLRIYDANNQKTAIQFADYVIARLPFQVQTIQTDNGAEFQSAFHWHLLDRGIAHRYIKPVTRGSTAKSSDPSGSMPRSSTGCWTAS